MKRYISIVVIILLIFMSTEIPVFAESSIDSKDTLKDTIVDFGQKITCTATINEDFVDDSIVVVLNNATSRELKEYNTSDFKEIPIESVDNLSTLVMNVIQQKRKNVSVSSEDFKIQSEYFRDEYCNEKKFHQYLILNLETNSKKDVLKYIKILEQRSDIMIASPNYIYEFADSPNDEYFSSEQWQFGKLGLTSAWNITTGSSTVNVGVVDSGIDASHPDLKKMIDKNLSRDFTGNNSPTTDTDGHGTQVAGIIGAEDNNFMGITGVCWDVNLISLKVCNSGEPTTASIIAALQYAEGMSIPILNMSISANGTDFSLNSAFYDYSGLLICAAGNDGAEIGFGSGEVLSYPALNNFDNTITVANTDKNDNLYTDSNYSAEYVDLGAPGVDIYTTTKNSKYASVYGTSFSAPHVTGVAALLKSKYPGMTTQGIKYYILNGVDKITALGNKVETGGRLNAYNSLNKVKSYTIKYVTNEGTGTMANTNVPYNYYTSLRKNLFNNNSLPFAGWHAKRSSDNKWYYTKNEKGGWYLEGSQPSGYSKKLYTNGEPVCMDISVNNDTVTMYAQWIDVEYTLKFNANSGNGTMSNQSIQYGVSERIKNNTFEKDDFTFVHWYAKNSEGKVYHSYGINNGWYNIGTAPSGYCRKGFSNNAYIHNLEGVDDGEIITLYAYWEPDFGELGDANLDGNITVADSTLIQKYIAGTANLSVIQLLLADVNYSGSVDIKDATMIQKYISNAIGYFG